MKKLLFIACIVSSLISAVIGQCNIYPLVFGSNKGATNITVVEFNPRYKQLWLGGATYDDNLAGNAGLNGGMNEYVPYIAKYNYYERKYQWAFSFPTLVGDQIINIAVHPDGNFIAAHTY